MKKILVITMLVLSSFGVFVAYAATTGAFTDQTAFATWFAPSVQKMQFNGIVKGYDDGSFKPSANVTRAELSVMLDRFATALDKPLNDGRIVCTLNIVYGLTLHINDQNGQPVTDATVSVDSPTAFIPDKNTIQGNGVYTGLEEANAGYYTITVEKAGYASYYETIKIEKNACHVLPQTRTITLFAKK